MWDTILIRESEIDHGYRFMQMTPPPNPQLEGPPCALPSRPESSAECAINKGSESQKHGQG